MRRTFVLLFTLLHGLSLFAQEAGFADHKPLVSSGNIPPDFLQFYIPSREFDTSRISGENAEKFRQQNAEMLSRLFASGKVLFNDPLSLYSQKVLDTLLSRDKTLKGKLRVYTLRSAEANAFTSHDGKIFITTGFLANLENEAQLAYVLAHESIHYRNNHLYRDYVQRKNAVPGSLAGLRFSREHEGEADIEGLRILLGSEYSPENIDWVLDVLFYSYLPVDNVPLDKKFFETKSFIIPDSLVLSEEGIGEIGQQDDNYNDIFQTHPSVSNRKKEIKSFLEFQKKDTLRKQFLFPEREFYNMRNIARFELSYIYYIDLKLEESIYNSYVMLQEFPGNAYLQRMMAGALYALCTHKKDSISFAKVHTPFTKLEGYQKQFSYLFGKMSAQQLCYMAYAYVSKCISEHPGNKELERIAEHAAHSAGMGEGRPRLQVSSLPAILVIPEISLNSENERYTSADLYESLKEQVSAMGEELKLQAVTLDPYTFVKSDIIRYNDLVLVNDWVSHRLKDGEHHIFIREIDIQQLIGKYGREVSLVSVTINRNSFIKRLFGKGFQVTLIAVTFDLYSGSLVRTGSGYTDAKIPFVEKKMLSDVLFKK